MTEAVHLMGCAFCWCEQQNKSASGSAEGPAGVYVARHKDRPDQPYWLCVRHADKAASDPEWTVRPAEPQSFPVTVFEPTGTRTQHILICSPGPGPGDTGSTTS